MPARQNVREGAPMHPARCGARSAGAHSGLRRGAGDRCTTVRRIARACPGRASNRRRSRAMGMDFSTGCQVMGNCRRRLCLTGWQFGRRANCNSKRRRPGICQVALSGAVGH